MISLAERVVEVLGVTGKPGEAWILQIGRSLVDCDRGVLGGKRSLIIDRDAKYTEPFRRLVCEAGTEVIRLPPRSPNLSAYAERFVRSITDECLNRMIFVGQALLRRAITEYMMHYHQERNHQRLDNRLIRQNPSMIAHDGCVSRHSLLGGMLNFYHRWQRERFRPGIWITRVRMNPRLTEPVYPSITYANKDCQCVSRPGFAGLPRALSASHLRHAPDPSGGRRLRSTRLSR